MTLPEITIMWFWLAIIALLCWSGSDLFSKIGCRDGRDKYNPLKMVIAVGVVMGLHAAYEIFIGGAVVTWHVIWTYLPVSLLYIGSMTLGYVGLRYIELSISSPICNSSGALVAVLCLLTGTLDESITGSMRYLVIGAVALVCIGAVGLGIVESTEDDELRRKRQEGSNYKYAKSWLAESFSFRKMRLQRTDATQADTSRSCRWPTACSTRRARSRTRSCSGRWTRTRPTARMS